MVATCGAFWSCSLIVMPTLVPTLVFTLVSTIVSVSKAYPHRTLTHNNIHIYFVWNLFNSTINVCCTGHGNLSKCLRQIQAVRVAFRCTRGCEILIITCSLLILNIPAKIIPRPDGSWTLRLVDLTPPSTLIDLKFVKHVFIQTKCTNALLNSTDPCVYACIQWVFN